MQIKKANGLSRLTRAPAWLQALVFWLAVMTGAGAWALVLLALGGDPDTELTRAAYVLGLYAWLLLLCHQLRRSLSLPLLTIWQPPLRLIQGALAATGLLGSLLCVQLLSGWGFWQAPSPEWPLILAQVLLMAVAIAWIEELVFRGLMLDLFAHTHSSATALQIQAGIYAGLHLVRTDLSPISWLSALSSLWLTGLVLGELRLRTGSLAASIGLHAGWVALTSFLAWSQSIRWQPESALWSGTGNPAYGLSGLVLMACVYGLIRVRAVRMTEPRP